MRRLHSSSWLFLTVRTAQVHVYGATESRNVLLSLRYFTTPMLVMNVAYSIMCLESTKGSSVIRRITHNMLFSQSNTLVSCCCFAQERSLSTHLVQDFRVTGVGSLVATCSGSYNCSGDNASHTK